MVNKNNLANIRLLKYNYKTMKILLTNDDGIQAPGLQALARKLAGTGHTVGICAPKICCSGKSMSLTIDKEIQLSKEQNPFTEISYAASGSTVDCVKIALTAIEYFKNADLLISGINNGYNAGHDLYYSATVGAAVESLHHQLPAIAVSRAAHNGQAGPDAPAAAAAFVALFPSLLELLEKYQKKYFLNVNIPQEYNGKKMYTAISRKSFYNTTYKINGNKYMLSGTMGTDFAKGTDLYALQQGYLSISLLNSSFNSPA